MLSILSSRVFAIADSDRSLCHIEIRPFYSADISLAHCSRDREAMILPSGINCCELDSAYSINRLSSS